uniref:Uncharacterized protein n=1 Tax=Arundo donax TaxID=35708 RepID=A0A0A9BQ05_ARUDO
MSPGTLPPPSWREEAPPSLQSLELDEMPHFAILVAGSCSKETLG